MRRAFTLLELLAVVVILGILASVIVPRLTSATVQAREVSLAEALRTVRGQILLFESQHGGRRAGVPAAAPTGPATEDEFVAHMTRVSDVAGRTAAAGTEGYPFGPYLPAIPVNPVNGKNTIQIVADDAPLPQEGDNSHGWLYQAGARTFRSDAPGSDAVGQPYVEY